MLRGGQGSRPHRRLQRQPPGDAPQDGELLQPASSIHLDATAAGGSDRDTAPPQAGANAGAGSDAGAGANAGSSSGAVQAWVPMPIPVQAATTVQVPAQVPTPAPASPWICAPRPARCKCWCAPTARSASRATCASLRQGQITLRGQLTTDRATHFAAQRPARPAGQRRGGALRRHRPGQGRAGRRASRTAARAQTAKPPGIALP